MSRINLNSLKESGEFLNILLDNINSAIFIVDSSYRIKNINQSFKALFSKPEEKIFNELCGNALGCSFVVEEHNNCGETTNCASCELRASLIQGFIEKLPTEKGILARFFYINDNKVRKFFRYTSKNISYNQEEMILVIFDDITEIEEKKQQLFELNEQKNRIIGIAAHDLRNPMGVVQSFSELLLDTLDDTEPEKQRELLEYIYESSKASIDLLNDLLDVSKIEAGKMDLHLKEQDYENFVKKIFELNKIFARKKNIALKLKIPKKLPLIEFDSGKIEQVLNNFISNAVKFSFPVSSIYVTVESDNDFITTTVRDEGQGIPENEHYKIFKEFQKTSVKTTGGERSTGLGLAITKKIVEHHNGEIGFLSEKGKGSSFFFRLPVKKSKSVTKYI